MPAVPFVKRQRPVPDLPDVAICHEHVVDEHLRARLSASPGTCGVCGETRDEVSTLAQLWEVIDEHFAKHFDTDHMAAPDDWEGPTLRAPDVYDWLLSDALDDAFESAFRSTLEAAIGAGSWVIDYDSSGDIVRYTWGQVSRAIREETRVPDFRDWEGAVHVTAAMFVGRFLRDFEEYALGAGDMLRVLPKGTTIYRGRMIDDLRDDTELGAPPPGMGAANRMSPRGVSLFYAADSPEVAVAEIAGHSAREYARVGAFRTNYPLQVLDLGKQPERLSPFGPAPTRDLAWSEAIGSILRDISQPIYADDDEHIEYAPTQVLTEFIRSLPSDPERSRTVSGLVEGLMFETSRDGVDGRNIVLWDPHLLDIGIGGSTLTPLTDETRTYRVRREYTGELI